jgi:adenylate kinase
MTQATREAAARPVERGTPSAPILVMLGAPGAGKGTQAVLLAARLGLLHVSTGDLFRAATREGSPLGDTVRPYLERGALVPDEVTVRVIGERLAQPDALTGVILDGFPRTRPQAQALDQLVRGRGGRVTGALYIEVEVDQLVERVAGRRVCTRSGSHVYHVDTRPPRVAGVCDVDGAPLEQRRDDRPETVRARLDRQLPPMYDVIDHYVETGVLLSVRGDRAIEEVTDELVRVVELAEKRG